VNGNQAFSWEGVSVQKLLAILEREEPASAEHYRQQIARFPSRVQFYRRLLIARCRRLAPQVDPADPLLAPLADSLGRGGVEVAVTDAGMFRYEQDELCTGAAFLGSPRSGKTTGVCHFVLGAQQGPQRTGVVIPDLRGDYHHLALLVEDALFVPEGRLRFNPLFPPPGISLRKWMHLVVPRLTHDLGLKEAGHAYALRQLTKMAEDYEQRGQVMTLPDFRDDLAAKRPQVRSADEGYLQRLLPRISTLVEVCGEDVLGVQEGHPIIGAAEAQRLVVLDFRAPKFVADFLTACLLYFVYYRRLLSQDPFGHPTILFVLDEQRSLIREQPRDLQIPDLELLFSRSRALSLGFLVAEQHPSQVAAPVLNACRLRLGFNTAPPESRRVADLLGLDQDQVDELYSLPVGTCIARLAGSRITHPFRCRIPSPDTWRTGP